MDLRQIRILLGEQVPVCANLTHIVSRRTLLQDAAYPGSRWLINQHVVLEREVLVIANRELDIFEELASY